MKKALAVFGALIALIVSFSTNIDLIYQVSASVLSTDKRKEISSIDGLIYYIDNNEVCISDYNGNKDELEIPSVIDGYTVTSIDDYAFSCTRVTSVIIPDTVIRIGQGAFNWCTALRSVTLSASITSIEEDTFYNCYNLQTLIIPEGVTSIGSNAFHCCEKLSEITFPKNITKICNLFTTKWYSNQPDGIMSATFYMNIKETCQKILK